MKKTRKVTESKPAEIEQLIKVRTSKEYTEYIKEYNKRLRQLEREASGTNMEYPE